MAAFSRDVLDAARDQREVRLTTRGRVSGKPRRVTVWISTDGKHLFVRSGAGMKRDWPQNLTANRHSELHRAKYGTNVKPSRTPDPLTPGEQATFELLPAE